MIFPAAVISTTAQTNASDVPLISPIKELPSEGNATTIASGRITLRNAWKYVMPSALAASICHFGTDSSEALITSALYADSLTASAINA